MSDILIPYTISTTYMRSLKNIMIFKQSQNAPTRKKNKKQIKYHNLMTMNEKEIPQKSVSMTRKGEI